MPLKLAFTIYVLGTLAVTIASAQQDNTFSKSLDFTSRDSAQVGLLIDESQKAMHTQGVKALQLAHRALDLADHLGDSLGIGLAHLQVARVFNHYGLFQRAIYQSERASKQLSQNSYTLAKANMMMELGIAYIHAREWKKAEAELKGAIHYFIALSNHQYRAKGYYYLALVEHANGKFQSSLEKLVRAQNILDRTDDSAFVIKVNGMLALSYLSVGQAGLGLSQAKNAYQDALALGDLLTLRDNMLILAKAYEANQQEAEAYRMLQKYTVLADSITFTTQMLDLESLQQAYEDQRSDPLSEAADQLGEMQDEPTSYLVALVTTLFVISSISVAYLLVYRVRLKNISAEQLALTAQLNESDKVIKKLEADAENTKRQYEILKTQQKHLLKVNEKLKDSNSELSVFNTSLEQSVNHRTWELLASNKELQEAHDEVDLFGYRASHDLKGPISTLEAVLALAQVECHEPSAITKFDLITVVVDKMKRFLNKLLLVHEIKNHTGITSMIEEAKIAKFFRDELKRKCSEIQVVSSVDDHDQVSLDWHLMKIVLAEIIENMVIYRDPIKHQSIAQLKIEQSNEHTFITIRDNGVGIRTQNISKVFDMFYRGTERSEGNGLGLYVVAKAMEKMGGQASIDSTEGESTTISLRF